MNAQNYDTYGDVMTVTEVGILLGMSRQQVYRMVREGRMQGVRLGRGYKIPKSAVKSDGHRAAMEHLRREQKQRHGAWLHAAVNHPTVNN